MKKTRHAAYPQSTSLHDCVTAHHAHNYSVAGIVVSVVVVVVIIAILVSFIVACCCPCCRYSLRIDPKKPGFNKVVIVDKREYEATEEKRASLSVPMRP